MFALVFCQIVLRHDALFVPINAYTNHSDTNNQNVIEELVLAFDILCRPRFFLHLDDV